MAAYVPLTTWADGDIILAADVQAELDNLREYLRTIPSDAIDTGWIDTEHIVKGTYAPLPNRAEFVSGDYAGINSRKAGLRTYATVYNTLRVGTDLWQYLPNTGLTLHVRRPCTMLISWYLCGAVTDNLSAGAAGEADIRLYIGNPTTRYGEYTMLQEELVTDGDRHTYRQFPSGFHIVDMASAGEYKIGLCGMNTSSKMRGVTWGMSVEAFAL